MKFMEDEFNGAGEEVDGVVSDKPFRKVSRRGASKSRCTKMMCKADDGAYVEVEICIKNGGIKKCKSASN